MSTTESPVARASLASHLVIAWVLFFWSCIIIRVLVYGGRS